MRRVCGAVLAILLLDALSAWGQVPFNATPTWTSTDVSNYSTGAGWVDLNRDGWLDLVVANGNDMARQRVVVYYSNNGSLPLTPSWQSSDIDYHGHLAIGDVNADGYSDIAVSVYIGAAGFSQKGKVKLYMNNAGTLSSQPSWISKDSMYTFSCAFGDVNRDGLPDLAVACGESYYSRPERNRIYYNVGGRLDSLPRWLSSAAGYSYDVGWADFDNDGDLDVVFANERGPNQMYLNVGDSISTAPSRISTDSSQYANSLFVGDVNNDGYFDLAISDNNQLGGSGRFKIYLNNAGTLGGTPFWTSSFSGYGSGINLVDVNDDGYRDLITGGWWQPLRIYMNQAGTFTASPQWTSSTNSVVEAIVFGDYDNDGLDTMIATYVSNGSQRLYYLPHPPLQTILHIVVGADTLAPNQFCYDLENGWVMLVAAPGSGVAVAFRFVASRDLDFAVSNWDNTIGNYVFRNLTPPASVSNVAQLPRETRLFPSFPNPFNPSTTIRFEIAEAGPVWLRVVDLLGREVATLVRGDMKCGSHEVQFFAGNSIASGVYLYQLLTGSRTLTEKFVLLR